MSLPEQIQNYYAKNGETITKAKRISIDPPIYHIYVNGNTDRYEKWKCVADEWQWRVHYK